MNISRGGEVIDTERVYSSDEGIVLSLPKKDAFGVLKIAVITTKKPKVNETFEIDFGTSAYQAWQSVLNKMSSSLSEDLQAVIQDVKEVQKIAMEQTEAVTEGLTVLAKSATLEAVKRSAIFSKEVSIQLAGVEAKVSEKMKDLAKLQEPVNGGILKAQVQSKLLWLKMQGKMDEYQKYEKAATEAIRVKHLSEQKKRGLKDAVDKKAVKEKRKLDEKAKKAAKKGARAGKKYGKAAR